MDVSLSLTPEVEKRLSERAAQQGKSLHRFIQEIVEKEALVGNGTEINVAMKPPHKPDGPQPAPGALDEDDMDTPWRGVLALEHDRETIFTTEMKFRIADLPRREPQVTISPRWIDDDE
jgi:hypothetical protein